MIGAGQRRGREAEDRLMLAYRTAELSRARKLRDPAFYLAAMKPRPRQTPAQLIDALQRMAASGAPISITSRPRER
jgi:hypothetical protein